MFHLRKKPLRGQKRGGSRTAKKKGKNNMGLFSGIEDAKVGGGGVYFLEGLYRCEIVKVFAMKSRKNEDLFIVECKVITSNNAKRKEGSACSWVVNMKHDAALGNIKGFIAAANGIDPTDTGTVDAEVNEEAVETACSDANPLAGQLVDLEATEILTRAKTPFTLHKWKPAE